MAPQPTRALVVVALVVACAGRSPNAGFATKPDQVETQRRCQQGSAAACGEVGRQLTDGLDGGPDFQRGLVLLEVACGQADLASCVFLADRYVRTSRDRRAVARAHELATRACERGFAAGCTELGEIVKHGEGGDPQAAADAFRKACDLGDARACELCALMEYERDEPGEKSAADQMLSKACGMGRLSSCHFLAIQLLEKPDTQAQGISLLLRTCSRGDGPTCASAALVSAPLVSTHPDCARARPLAEQACRMSAQVGCVIRDACSLEEASQAGAALERLRTACAPRAPLACLYWADQSARSPATDSSQIRRDQIIHAYRLACQPGRDDHTSMVACAGLAMAELATAQSKIQAEAAIAQLKHECERSSREACCDLGEQYRTGRWVPVDAEKAQDLRTRACNLGCDRCCR